MKRLTYEQFMNIHGNKKVSIIHLNMYSRYIVFQGEGVTVKICGDIILEFDQSYSVMYLAHKTQSGSFTAMTEDEYYER